MYAWFGVIFLLAEFLGNAFGYGVESISVLWPPTGVLGATLAVLHRRHWIPILLIASCFDFAVGAVSNNFRTDPDFLTYLFVGLITNPMTALVFATTFRRLIPNARPLSDPKHFGLYVLIPIVLNTAMVSFFAVSLLGFFIDDFPVSAAWQQWWYSDVTGLLTFATPIIMIASSWDRISNAHSKTFEASLMMLAFVIISAILFTDRIDSSFVRHYEFVLMLPIYAWIVSRFGAVVMSLTTLAFTIVVLAALVNHASPFDVLDRSTADNVLAVQGFLVPVTLIVLFTASILESRKTQFQQNLDHDRQLRKLSRIESLGTMAGGMAHDFGNLVIAMRAYHSVLRTQIKDPNETVITAIEGLDEAADGAQTLTRSLMEVARDEHEDRSEAAESIDLCQAVENAISSIKPLITPKYILDVRLPEEPIFVNAREPDIQRILGNLIINARDASEVGQRIEVVVKKHVGGVWLLITDEGSGMSSDVQDRVFDPFFTTKPRGQGTGLGLAVVAGIVRDMGATIDIASTLGEGTTIVLSWSSVESNPE